MLAGASTMVSYMKTFLMALPRLFWMFVVCAAGSCGESQEDHGPEYIEGPVNDCLGKYCPLGPCGPFPDDDPFCVNVYTAPFDQDTELCTSQETGSYCIWIRLDVAPYVKTFVVSCERGDVASIEFCESQWCKVATEEVLECAPSR
jgi:hypothetical protein